MTPTERLLHRVAEGKLAGPGAQLRMGHMFRGGLPDPPTDARPASVLSLFFPVDGRMHLLFIQRTSPPGDRHAGQISFPGGSADPEDDSAAATALRELEEEVGVAAGRVELVGRYTSLYIPVSNFLVTPFVGTLDARPELTPQESEVARTIELPFEDFLRPDAVVTRDRKLPNGLRLSDVPHWSVGDELIWGATAMMTAELVAMAEE